ncbi:MAG: endonuclease/exonuclease/phosphatase family protein [Tenericutes bacterium]|nr:endonuclease/exonuclease/phosphatase family protein [Mycoplasmatota bacterium]
MKLNICSFNIRIDVESDGNNAWEHRKQKVVNFINKNKFDVVGFQEVNPNMQRFLVDELSDYESFGTPRSENNELNPIFIKKKLFKVIDSNTYWLTRTPHTPSVIEGSHFPRIATYVVVEDKDGDTLTFFNTHFDYANDKVGYKQAKYFYKELKKVEKEHESAIIVTGDFNQIPDSKTMNYLNKKLDWVYDVREHVGLTFHGFTDEVEGYPIDYILFSKHFVLKAFVIGHHAGKNDFLSDHYPIFACLEKAK